MWLLKTGDPLIGHISRFDCSGQKFSKTEPTTCLLESWHVNHFSYPRNVYYRKNSKTGTPTKIKTKFVLQMERFDFNPLKCQTKISADSTLFFHFYLSKEIRLDV